MLHEKRENNRKCVLENTTLTENKKKPNPMWHLHQLETVIKACPEEVRWHYTTVPNLQAR